MIEVFADIVCPFAHASLRYLDGYRRDHGAAVGIHVRAWPLELVNGQPVDPHVLAEEVEAIRAGVAPTLFAGFDPDRFPSTSVPALVAEVAAYRAGAAVGERFSLAVREALWEQGLDIGDPAVLARIGAGVGAPEPTPADEAAVREAWQEGRARGVVGSPHFFTPTGDFFCPTLDISHGADGFAVRFDRAGFERFVDAATAGV